MKSSIWTDYYEILTPEETILALRVGGFSYGELGIDHSRMLLQRSPNMEKTGLAFRSFLADSGYSLPQGHLDFQWDLTAPETVDRLKKELTLFQAVGVQKGIIHINGGLELPEEARRERQLNTMRQLLEFVKGTDFTICIENLRPNPDVADADKILTWIEKLGSKNLGICLDTGHLHVANISMKTTTQTQGEFIRKAGSYLQATHINGNDGTDDYHLAPYSIKNSIDWQEVVLALRQIGYQGLFSMEVPGEVKGHPPMYIMKHKLLYLKKLADYMLSAEFIKQ